MSPSPSISAVVNVTDSSSHSENGTGDKSASASASGPGGDDAVYVSLTESRVLLAEQLKLKQELAELREALALAHRSIANTKEDKNNLERRYQEEVRSVQQALDITKRQVDAESRARHELQKHVTMLAEPMDGEDGESGGSPDSSAKSAQRSTNWLFGALSPGNAAAMPGASPSHNSREVALQLRAQLANVQSELELERAARETACARVDELNEEVRVSEAGAEVLRKSLNEAERRIAEWKHELVKTTEEKDAKQSAAEYWKSILTAKEHALHELEQRHDTLEAAQSDLSERHAAEKRRVAQLEATLEAVHARSPQLGGVSEAEHSAVQRRLAEAEAEVARLNKVAATSAVGNEKDANDNAHASPAPAMVEDLRQQLREEVASRRDAESRLRGAETRLLEETYALKAAADKKDVQLSHAREEVQRLASQLDSSASTSSARVSELEARIAHMSSELAEAQANERAAERQLTSVSANADANAERLQKIEGALDGYREEISRASAVAAERTALEARARDAERRLEEATRELATRSAAASEASTSEAAAASEAVAKLRREVEQLEFEKERAESRLASRDADWETERVRLESRASNLTSELDEAFRQLRETAAKLGSAELVASQLTSQKEYAERELSLAMEKDVEHEKKIKSLEENLRGAQQDLSEAETAREAAKKNYSASEGEHAGQLATKVAELSEANASLQQAKAELAEQTRRLEEMRGAAAKSNDEVAQLRDQLAKAVDDARRPPVTTTGAQTEVDENVAKLGRLETALSNAKTQLDEHRERADAMTKVAEALQSREHAHEQVRRMMHFTIQELKGCVRVFVRVRPQLQVGEGNKPKDGLLASNEMTTGCIVHEDSLRADMLGRGVEPVGLLMGAGRYDFKFDKVLSPRSSQLDVYDEVSMLVTSAVYGRKVCVLAYGQTGSGKTHTMLGGSDSESSEYELEDDAAEDGTVDLLETFAPTTSEGTDENGGVGITLPVSAGLFPRAIAQLISAMKKEKRAAEAGGDGAKDSRPFQLYAQLVEVYCDSVYDLLHPSMDQKQEDDIGGGAPEVTVRQHMSANVPSSSASVPTPVPDATFYEIKSRSRTTALLSRAMANRRTSATRMNDTSSRSHLCLLLYTVECREGGAIGCVSLADLAGSERLSRSGAMGDRLRETQSINKSLSALGDVVDARRKESSHVPYRNSKLTHLLQPTLQGQVLMIVALSPDSSSANETLCSLRFAEKANGASVGAGSSSSGGVGVGGVSPRPGPSR